MFRRVVPFAAAATLCLAACGDSPGASVAADVSCVGCDSGSIVDFGVVPVGAGAQREILLRNTGSAPAQIAEVPAKALGDAFSSDLVCRASGCATRTIEPGGQLSVVIAYRPEAEQAATATLALGPDGPTLQLLGAGGTSTLRCTTEIHFGTLVRNETASRTIECVNEGTLVQAVRFGPIEGVAAREFALQGTLEKQVAAGESASVSVSFVAVDGGVREAVVPVFAGGKRVRKVHVQASALESALQFDGGSSCFDLGMQKIGAQGAFGVPLSNRSDATVQIRSARFEDGATPGLVAAGASFEVAPGASAVIPLAFTPVLPGHAQGTLVVESDDPAGLHRVCVRGAGGGPELSCGVGQLDLGLAATGIGVTKRLRCTNVGEDVPGTHADRLHIEALQVEGPFAAEVIGGIPDLGWAPGESFEIEVGFTPPEAGPAAGTLRVLSNDVGGDRVLSLAGEGLDAADCDAVFSASSLDFGRVWRDSLALPLTVANQGTGPCLIEALPPADGAPFSSWEGAWLLPAGTSVDLDVVFDPGSVNGSWASAMPFRVSELSAPVHTVAVTATSGDSCIKARPGIVDLGTVPAACAARAAEIRLLNECEKDVNVTAIDIEGSGFALENAPELPAVIPSYDALSLHVVGGSHASEDLRGAVRVVTDAMSEAVVVPAVAQVRHDPLVTERFRSSPAALDVLLVIDNSSGSEPEFWLHPSTFLSELGPDYHVGITTTGVTSGSGCPGGVGGFEDGRLFPVIGTTPRIIESSMPFAAQVDALWENAHVGHCHGTERGLHAMRNALSAPVINHADDPRHPERNDGNLGFLREHAALAVLVHSDEPDQSPGEPAAYVRFLRALKDDPRDVRFHAIVGDRDTGCSYPGGSGAQGGGYIDVVEGTGGVHHLFCSQSPLPSFSTALARGITGSRCYPLRAAPRDVNHDGVVGDQGSPPDLQVFLNGTRAPSLNSRGNLVWSYEANTNAICFEDRFLVEPGVQIEVTYAPACGGPLAAP